MGVLVAVGVAIASTIAAVAAVVGTVIATVVTSLVSALAAVGVAIASAVAGTVTGVLSALGIITTETATGVLTSLGLSNTIGTMTQLSIGKWVSTIGTMWKSFAEAIHLKTLLQLHEIAYIVSSDYRKMMQRVYGRISEVSDALGFYPQFIGLALRNARTVVLDASTLLGRKYDLGEITWFQNLNEFCTELGDNFKKYKKNPEAIFDLLDQLIIKPQCDVAGEASRTVLGTMDQLVERTGEMVNAMMEVTDGVNTFISDLPAAWKGDIAKVIRKQIENFNWWEKNRFAPTIDALDTIVEALQEKDATHKKAIDELVAQILKPGDALYSIDKLPFDERLDQENKVYEYMSRRYQEHSDNLVIESAGVMEQLETIASALKEPLEKVEWLVPEIEAPQERPQEEIEQTETWYVGDY